MKLNELKPAAYNPRTITDEQLQRLKKSLSEFGDLSGIVYNRKTGSLVGGHQRLKCLPPDAKIEKKDLKEKTKTGTVAQGFVIFDNEKYTYREVDWDEATEKMANIAANKHGGEWDNEKLGMILQELSEMTGFDPDLVGFETKEINEIISQITGQGMIDDDEVPEVDTEPITKTGDIYILGNHRLLCGDSTKKEDVERLMDGKEGSCIWIDPPYNVNYGEKAEMLNKYKGGQRNTSTILNDNMGSKQFYEFLLTVFSNIYAVSRPGAAIYVAHSEKEGINFRTAFINAGFYLSSCLIWRKNALVMGRSDYHWQHEPILYGWKDTGAHSWFGGRNKTTIHEFLDEPFQQIGDNKWQIPMGETALIITGDNVTVEAIHGTIFCEAKPAKNIEHPTMKPVALIVRMISNSTIKGENVLDLFLGAGSTLIACEKTNRTCYGMELDPHYCDVIVTRYCKYTGNNKIIKNGKEITWQLPDNTE